MARFTLRRKVVLLVLGAVVATAWSSSATTYRRAAPAQAVEQVLQPAQVRVTPHERPGRLALRCGTHRRPPRRLVPQPAEHLIAPGAFPGPVSIVGPWACA